MTDAKKRVLFTCIHHSARSQMAEAFLKQLEEAMSLLHRHRRGSWPPFSYES
jgi:protein-tyrosine-phosphatase